VRGWEAPTLLVPLERANTYHWTKRLPPLSPVDGTRCSFPNICHLENRTMDKFKPPVIPSDAHRHQKPLEFTSELFQPIIYEVLLLQKPRYTYTLTYIKYSANKTECLNTILRKAHNQFEITLIIYTFIIAVAENNSVRMLCLNNCVLLISNIDVEAVGGGLPSDVLNTIIDLVKPYFEDDILSFIEDKMKSTLEEALVDFDIREILDL
jgi:hypothetical protein